MDIERGERELLNSVWIREFADFSIIGEMHESEEPGKTAEIVGRFCAIHRIMRIPARERSARDLSEVVGLTPWGCVAAAFERSVKAQEWLWMVTAAS